MVTAIKMPKLGLSGETSLIGQWIKKKGDRVTVGEHILTVETDKASFEVEAEAEGVLLDIFYEEGDEVPVLTPVGVIGEKGEDLSEFTTAPITNSISSGAMKENPINFTMPNQGEKTKADSRVHTQLKISPRARKTAERLNLDYRLAEPSGAEGRVIEKDVLELLNKSPRYTNAAKAADHGEQPNVICGSGIGGRITQQDLSNNSPTNQIMSPLNDLTQDYEVQTLSRMRKIIAKNMMNSLQHSAQLTLTTSFDASTILEFRNKIKMQKESLGLEDVTLNDMILYALSRTLINHKALNAHLIDDNLLVFQTVHLGLAVDTPKGLIVPTLFGANKLSLMDLSKASKEMVLKCKSETILPHEMQGASFTVTNLGSFGIESFTPVLNAPQVAILGVNTITNRLKQVDGTDITYPAMGLSLTFDHRALDGAPAARFLKELTSNLEHFDLLLAK
jgi:pyruvate dehydrogenase E2 component (dihydrolipoamide acetyltransferase)